MYPNFIPILCKYAGYVKIEIIKHMKVSKYKSKKTGITRQMRNISEET